MPPGSCADIAPEVLAMAVLIPTGLVAALTRCRTSQSTGRGARGWGQGCWQQVDTIGSDEQDLLPAPHFPAWLWGTQTLKDTTKCIPCSQLCPMSQSCLQQNRVGFSSFLLVVLRGLTQEAPASLRTFTAPASGSVPGAARADLAPAPCAPYGPAVPCHRDGAEERTEAALAAGT